MTDPSKATVPDAKIAAVNISTNFRYETATNGAGEYTLPNLPPGTYQIQVVSLHVQDYARSVLALDPSLDVSQYAHTAWRIRDGITSGAVYPIAETPDGYLWLGTNFGLLCFDGVRAHHRSRRRIDSLKESSDE